jgi:hypothetical protein
MEHSVLGIVPQKYGIICYSTLFGEKIFPDLSCMAEKAVILAH